MARPKPICRTQPDHHHALRPQLHALAWIKTSEVRYRSQEYEADPSCSEVQTSNGPSANSITHGRGVAATRSSLGPPAANHHVGYMVAWRSCGSNANGLCKRPALVRQGEGPRERTPDASGLAAKPSAVAFFCFASASRCHRVSGSGTMQRGEVRHHFHVSSRRPVQ